METKSKTTQYFKEINKEWTLKPDNYMLKCSAILNLIIYELYKDQLLYDQNYHIVQIQTI